jgi:GNAT superfamily N-acetyltransferase
MSSPPTHHRHSRPAPKTLSIADDLQICIRPITPEDRERVLNGLQSITVETSYRRFFTPSFYPSDDELRYLTDVDYDRHVALGAVDCTREGHPGIGAARYVRLADEPAVAEAAVLVIDAYQHRGIGSLLLAALSQYAAQNGVARFRGFVLRDNDAFLSFLRALGALDETTREGVVQIDLPVYPDSDPVPKTPLTERAHWAWDKLQTADERVC